MQKIHVSLQSSSYDILLAHNELAEMLKGYRESWRQYDQIVVIPDEHVWQLHEHYFREAMTMNGLENYLVKPIPAGESSKSIDVWEEVQTFLLQQNCNRNTLLVAFGGGACGDVVGFIAATFLRGVDYCQMPTTVLAHDSSVGGKTAINHSLGKNLLGAFHQPIAVLYDSSFFDTLSEKEFRSGFAELWKHAWLSDANWLQELEISVLQNSWRSIPWVAELTKGIQVKVSIVERDVFERHERKYLNFGHTFSHALEKGIGYSEISHGEAVAIGILFDLLISAEKGFIPHQLVKEKITFIHSLGYPLNKVSSVPFENYYELMVRDKKATKTGIQFVLLHTIGNPVVETIEKKLLLHAYHLFQQLIEEVAND
ncbi:3-dehydroquinate synthase [Paenisporosarcina cavernae]|nr:3-dehydroquinate synthase [Paenisporosarcina cavernae]